MSIFKDKNFKKDKYVDKDGYIMVRMSEHEKPLYHPMYKARGFGFEHRINMAKKIGRPLTAHETVHHIDKNRQNNHPDNLEIHKRNYHHRQHIKNGDYKLFSKEYQPRWKKEAAMSGNTKRVLSTLGGALLGNIPAALTYKKSIKVDNPEEKKGLKRKALEQAALGTLGGAFGGYTVGGYLKNTGRSEENNKNRDTWWKRFKERKIDASKALDPIIGGSIGGYIGNKSVGNSEDDSPELRKRKKIFGGIVGGGIGTGAGILNIITR